MRQDFLCIRLFAKGCFLMYSSCFVVAGKCIVYEFFVWLLGKEAYNRYNNQSGYHGNNTTVNGGLHDCREGTLEENVGYHQDGAKPEAYMTRCFGDLLGVEGIHKWCQEGTCKCAPRYTHELCDECHIALVLN